MGVLINPSILSADFCNLGNDVKKLQDAGVKSIHIDVMDGNFVPNITFGPAQIKSLRQITNMKFDVHLMVYEPIRFIKDFVEAGADSITVHAESCTHLARTISEIKRSGIEAGVALNPSTPLDNIEYVLDSVDKVLIMTVNPGFGGQKFIPAMNKKIEKLNNMIVPYPHVVIQVDGGISEDNILNMVELGVGDIVMGSSIFKGRDIKKNIERFKSILGGSEK